MYVSQSEILEISSIRTGPVETKSHKTHALVTFGATEDVSNPGTVTDCQTDYIEGSKKRSDVLNIRYLIQYKLDKNFCIHIPPGTTIRE